MGTDDWISITEAAARLTSAGDAVDRSTLSRYLKQHSEALPLKPAGKSNLVEFGALVEHRRENIRLKPVVEARPIPGRTATVSRFAGSQSDGAARKAQADAEMREMDLAMRRGQLTVVSEVDRAGRDAVALMQSAFEQALETEAASLALKYSWDERAVRLALKSFVRRGIDVFHRQIMTAIDEMSRAEGASDEAA